MTWLGNLSWPAVERRAADSVLVVPIGSTEQHGPHLPLSTDADIARALCAEAAARRAGLVVAPVLPYGASGEHAGFAGTVSIGAPALERVLVELVRSATMTFSRVFVVSAHGGNAEAVAAAVAVSRREGRQAAAWTPRWDGDAHAGFVETSLQLSLNPALVDMRSAAAGATSALAALLPAMREHGVRAVSANGVLGDPAGAQAEEGRRILDLLVDDMLTVLDRWSGVGERR